MRMTEINNVVVVGAGAMGSQIGMLCALAGLDATVTDIAQRRWTRRKPNCGSVCPGTSRRGGAVDGTLMPPSAGCPSVPT